MTASFEALEWDSDFFDVPIGRITIDGATPEEVADVEADARRSGIVCLYASLDPTFTTQSYAIQELGYRLVETGITFRRGVEPPPPEPPFPGWTRQGGPDDVDALAGAIDLLAPWSRFAVDPRFGPSQARRMHEAWVRRAATCEDGRFHLVVAEDDDGITGFATYSSEPVPRMDLQCAVRPGVGAATRLSIHAVEWAGDRPVLAGPCAARNMAILRHLESCGFRSYEARYHFHRWLDEDSPC